MITSEQEMVKKPVQPAVNDRSTSLQPTYEDSVPTSDDDWELEDE